MIRTIGIALFCAGSLSLLAQDGGDKVNVPLHDPSTPPRVHVNLLMGSITVRGADIRDVEVQAHSRGRDEERESRPPRADGMKRLDMGSSGLDVVEDNNVVSIKTSWSRPADLVVTVPRHSSLELRSVNDGDISVEQVDGEIDANDLNGRITLKNVGGSVVAHSLNGAVFVSMGRVDPAKPMSFSTLNGNIDVTLPDSVKANVRMKTDNGEIYSDFDVKLDPGSRVVQNEPGSGGDGKYHVRFDRTLRGTINGGGPEFQFTSFNGQIYIRKAK